MRRSLNGFFTCLARTPPPKVSSSYPKLDTGGRKTRSQQNSGLLKCRVNPLQRTVLGVLKSVCRHVTVTIVFWRVCNSPEQSTMPLCTLTPSSPWPHGSASTTCFVSVALAFSRMPQKHNHTACSFLQTLIFQLLLYLIFYFACWGWYMCHRVCVGGQRKTLWIWFSPSTVCVGTKLLSSHLVESAFASWAIFPAFSQFLKVIALFFR